MENFSSLGLPQPLLNALEKMKFDKPTPIQAQAIPHALAGRDVLGSAQTGTGKTAAFGIPMLARLLKDTNNNSMALVMTPTRELAAQVAAAVRQMAEGSHHIKIALLIGGESMFKQLQQLRARPRIIVGTPGRINDHLEQRSLNLSTANFLVLDETDRMLDMGFGPQIDRIVRRMPKERQTLLFSATLPNHIVKIAEQYLIRPERVAAGSTTQPIEKIKQELVRLNAADKYSALLTQLTARTGSVIVFVRTKRGADRLAQKLGGANHSAAAIHGNLNQNQRNRVIQAFRDKKHRIMVATDVAARGLDIPHIEHVINYDLPQVAEDYIHRIGRTARAGAEGSAVCFITPEDYELWGAIDDILNPGAKPAHRRGNPSADASAHPRPQQRPRHKGRGPGRPNGAPRGNGGRHDSRGDSRRDHGFDSRREHHGESRRDNHGEGRREHSSEGRREHSSEGRRDNGQQRDRHSDGRGSHNGNRGNVPRGAAAGGQGGKSAAPAVQGAGANDFRSPQRRAFR